MSTPPNAPGTPGHRQSLPIYIGSGFLAVGGHYSVTVAGVELLDAQPLAASAVGFCVGAAIKYVLNYFLAFRSAEKHSDAVPRFTLALGMLFALNALFFWLLHERLGLHYFLAQVLTTGLLIPPGYLISRLWIFAASRPGARA